jgi:hypothetical protein
MADRKQLLMDLSLDIEADFYADMRIIGYTVNL